MSAWCAEAGVSLAPHGKTTMSPQLWSRQLAAGAWAITLATGWQVQLARMFSVRRVLLANELVDPAALRWVRAELDRDSEFEFFCWVDDPETVRVMERALGAPAGRHIRVLVELGAPGGRAGARDTETALATARAVAESRHLSLAGVAGWEGVLGHHRSAHDTRVLHQYLERLADLHTTLSRERAPGEDRIITAGGSAFPDLVVERLAPLADEGTSVVLRSGCYLTHDDGHYARLSPLAEGHVEHPLRSALHAWARTISRPEPGLALLDAGRRDVPFDSGLPTPQRLATGEPVGGEIIALNDQHGFLRLADTSTEVAVGSVVRLGLSHPCTAFDKWRLIPVIDDADSDDPRIVDFVHTYF
jgi:D-serine deaminase-like pyridoxal phosphate-dependent protein